MSKGNLPAYPETFFNDGDRNAQAPDGAIVPPQGMHHMPGLTIRELAALQIYAVAVNSANPKNADCRDMARVSFEAADAFVATLDKQVAP